MYMNVRKDIVRFTCRLLGLLAFLVLLWTIFVHDYLKRHSKKPKFAREVWREFGSKKREVSNKNVVIPDNVRTNQVNCKAIIKNNQTEINRTLHFMKVFKTKVWTPYYYLRKTRNCTNFLNQRKYIRKTLTKKEARFPIAYSIMIYKDIEQFERLLRAIYRPQNYYCVHVDAKSPDIFHLGVQSILGCFPNVFVASSLLNVEWGGITALQADIICMKDLWQRFKSWKYFINLTGQEFPLRTNNELVDILETYKHTADVRKTTYYANTVSRWKNRLKYKHWHGKKSKIKLEPLPYDLTMTKGSCHVALPRSFVAYIVQSWVAKDFLEWLRYTHVPDETYMATLNYSPQLNIPGAYTGNRRRFIRYKNWNNVPCYGKVVRGICVNGLGDLHYITKRPEFFVNKFNIDVQYLTLDCMEEWFYNRTRAYYQGSISFDVKPYLYNEPESTNASYIEAFFKF